MIIFASTSSFRKCLAELLKVRRGVYSGVKTEICRAFNDVPIEQIRTNHDMILADNDSVVIKLRLPDKHQRLSKSDGYRLIYMVMKHVELVVFLEIYPKRGPMQKINITDNDLARLIHEFVDEFNNSTIVFHDIQQELAEITNNKEK